MFFSFCEGSLSHAIIDLLFFLNFAVKDILSIISLIRQRHLRLILGLVFAFHVSFWSISEFLNYSFRQVVIVEELLHIEMDCIVSFVADVDLVHGLHLGECVGTKFEGVVVELLLADVQRIILRVERRYIEEKLF